MEAAGDHFLSLLLHPLTTVRCSLMHAHFVSAVEWVSGKEVAAVVVLRPGGHVTLQLVSAEAGEPPPCRQQLRSMCSHSVPGGRGPSNVLAWVQYASRNQLGGGLHPSSAVGVAFDDGGFATI